MVHKYEGDWRLRFIRVTDSGELVITERGTLHIETITGGNIEDATDTDGTTPVRGRVSNHGPFEGIHFNRTRDPLRHFRGVEVFRKIVGGELHLALVGERKIGPFPEDPDFKAGAGKSDDRDADAASQEDGVWIATKP